MICSCVHSWFMYKDLLSEQIINWEIISRVSECMDHQFCPAHIYYICNAMRGDISTGNELLFQLKYYTPQCRVGGEACVSRYLSWGRVVRVKEVDTCWHSSSEPLASSCYLIQWCPVLQSPWGPGIKLEVGPAHRSMICPMEWPLYTVDPGTGGPRTRGTKDLQLLRKTEMQLYT